MSKIAYIGACALLVQAACSDLTAPDTSRDAERISRVSVAVNLSTAPTMTAVRLSVTAADLPDTLWFQLVLDAGVARGTAIVPAGPQRTFTLEALDANGVVWYRGSATADVVPGQNPPLTIILTPVDPNGEVPIVGEIGSYTLELSHSELALVVGDTLRVTATVRDPSGAPVPDARPSWTTDDATIAFFDVEGSTALVRANGPGRVFIRAQYEDLVVQIPVSVAAP